MLQNYNNKYLVIDDEAKTLSYTITYHTIITYFVLNAMNKLGEGIAQQIYSRWFEYSNKIAHTQSKNLEDVWSELLILLNEYYYQPVVVAFPFYFLKINLVTFSDDEFALEEFMKGHIVLKNDNEYLLQYLISKFENGLLTSPEKCMDTIREFSNNRFLSIDFEKVFHDRLKTRKS